MALTIHRPHLPHAGDWTRPSTVLLSGLVAVGIAAGAVIAVQQFDGSPPAPAKSDLRPIDAEVGPNVGLAPGWNMGQRTEVPAVGAAPADAEALSPEALAAELAAINGGR